MVIWVNNKVYIFGSMTMKTTHVKGKGGYNGWMTLKFGRCVCVELLHRCAKFHSSRVNSCRENPDFMTIDFSPNFHLNFQEFKSCFLTGMFQIEFRCLLMTGANSDKEFQRFTVSSISIRIKSLRKN